MTPKVKKEAEQAASRRAVLGKQPQLRAAAGQGMDPAKLSGMLGVLKYNAEHGK